VSFQFCGQFFSKRGTGLTLIQRFLTVVLPKAWAEDIRADSLAWMMLCTCGYERSIWESGGIRWKGKGSKRRLAACPQCGRQTWHTIYRKSGD
jgi:hypothetical protein